MKTTIYSEYGNILESQTEVDPVLNNEGVEISVWKIENITQRKLDETLDTGFVYHLLDDSLNEQRKKRDDWDLTMDIRSVDDINRQKIMAGLRHSIVNFAYRAFSLPVDYRITNADGESEATQNRIIESIVIQPEFLSDDFLIALGYMSEDEKLLPQEEKVAIKVLALPEIKQMLKDLMPLSLGSGKSTGRISLISNPKNPNFGKYIVFQETTGIQNVTETKRRKKVRTVAPRVYDSMYSLIRSQKHAQERMREKISFLQYLRSDILTAVILRWQQKDYSLDQKKGDVTQLRDMLQGKVSFHEKQALEDRLDKIDFRHGENDLMRLQGVCNDLLKETQEKIGKTTEIYKQTLWLEEYESRERRRFEIFYDEIIRDIELSNIHMQDLKPGDLAKGGYIGGVETNKVKKIFMTAFHYMDTILRSDINSLGYPFHTIRPLIAGFTIDMKNSLQTNDGRIGIDGLRIILRFILELKTVRFQILSAKVFHTIRLHEKNTIPDPLKEKLLDEIHRVILSIEEVGFLPSVELTTIGQEKFEDMIASLQEVYNYLLGLPSVSQVNQTVQAALDDPLVQS